ncbi:MAG: hypothetical protein HQ567_09990 [Candidatus Nealsonbacteria bacterium]|nr:hypothetical protein [Candidatus Nealsonbacteria bacterium]
MKLRYIVTLSAAFVLVAVFGTSMAEARVFRQVRTTTPVVRTNTNQVVRPPVRCVPSRYVNTSRQWTTSPKSLWQLGEWPPYK